MSVLDGDFSTDETLTASGDGIWSPSRPGPPGAPRDLRSLYEKERARAEAAEARCEELRWAEVAARSDAGVWKWRFKSCRRRLSEAAEEAKELRRAVKDTPSLQAEVVHLRKRLWEATGPGEDGRVASLRDEVTRLRKALAASEARKTAAGRRTGVERSLEHAGAIRSLRTENKRLHKELGQWRKAVGEFHGKLDREKERAESIRETARKLSNENLRLHREIRFLRDTEARALSLSDQVFWLRHALEGSRAGQKKLTARIARLRAAGATLSKLPFDEAAHLRTVLRRSRRQKATIKSLSRENARLHRAVKGSRGRIEALQAQLARLRSTGAVLSKMLYGRRSEQQDRPRSERKRGQQRGAPGHGRTRRPGLKERPETLDPPPEACVCARCGQAYAPNGVEESTLVEIEVKAHKRVVRRPRLRRSCECASSPLEVSAPPVPRLFPGTLYGTSFWARFLFEHCACFRPVHQVAAWMAGQGLTVSPGTLANSRKRFVALFDPLAGAILAHQNEASLRHADETTWRIRELRTEERSSRAWMWTSVSTDAVYFHIDPSRSAEAADKLFSEALLHTVIVCDRYSAYKRLARLGENKVILATCWAHVRRDFIECAAGQASLTEWCRQWVERIAAVYRLNEARLKRYDPGPERQTPAFEAAQDKLRKALDGLFANAGKELAALPDQAREGRPLRSLLNHREELSVFVDRPQAPMDNNRAERFLRRPSIARRLSLGSDSEKGARFTAVMYSVLGTLSMNGIDVLRWLEAWLDACARNRRQPPEDLSPWLPWSMGQERRRQLTALP